MAKVFVCGDVVNLSSSGGFIGDSLIREIRKADYSICNFEGPELEEGQTASFPHQEHGTAAYLKDVGFNLMLLANNHITELEADGVRYSIETIKKVGAEYIGAGLSWEEAYRPLVRTIEGIRFGFVNIGEAQTGYYLSPDQAYGYAWMGSKGVFDVVKSLSSQTDHVIVFVHAGLEHYSLPLPFYRNFYKSLCDAGASCIIASHPHCAQGFEKYDKKFIAYSLGNFYFPRPNKAWPEENTSFSLLLDFNKESIVDAKPIHHRLDNGVVDLINDQSQCSNVSWLCELLRDNYEARVTEMCVRDYKDIIEKRLAGCFCGEYSSITLHERLKNIVRYIVLRKKYVVNTRQERIKSLLPLFENESRRNSIIIALKNIK